MKIARSLLPLPALLAGVFIALTAGAFAAPVRIMREGLARPRPIQVAKLPPGTDAHLFGAEVTGTTFDIFVRDLPAQTLTLELGFVDTQSHGPAENTFSLDANGTPLDANLDVWSMAGGAYKPWVMKTTFVHSGGSLAIHFTGLGKPAFLSYARFLDANGNVLATGAATAEWQKSERLTLLDSRSRPYHVVKVGEVPFFDVDHSPVGAWSTFIYGMEQSGGVQVCKQPGGEGTLVPDQGVIVAVKNGAAERVMPFTKQKGLPAGEWITDKEVTRSLGACTDHWQAPMGLSWTHYTPVWAMKDWDTATMQEKRRFVLPVTWMQYTIDNRGGSQETQLLFSLEQSAQKAQGLTGFEGYTVAEDTTIAVPSGDADLLTADQVKSGFGLEGATSAFCVHVPAGTRKVVTFYIAHYKDGEEANLDGHPLKLMYDELFTDLNDILKTAQASLPSVISRCAEVDQKLANCGQDDERKFLAADTLHSYQYNTILHGDEKQNPVWAVIEGECSCINTFDLTVDHVFYELAMHPWTVRNELDHFVNPFSYTDELSLPGETQRYPGGLGFWHDMGSRINFSTHAKGASYSTLMTQEELQNWLICASLYWKTTGDNAWLARNRDVFNRGLKSMQLRDDLDPAKRDGITTYMSNVGDKSGEITTYDAMDASLRHPIDSLYIAMKSFAVYTMLRPVFQQLGEPDQEQQTKAAEAYTAKGILSHWDQGKQYFPALFAGAKSASAIIPGIEGLAYPYAMGLKKDVALDGPNADLINHLKTHMTTILVPGVCIDAKTKGWNLSSSSSTTWVSKVYLNQFITENVLGIKNATTGRDADEALYAYEVLGAPAVGWTDQFFTDSHIAYGCRHYPRGVTSALWWLWPLHGTAE